MSKIRYAQQFIEEASSIKSASKRDEMRRRVEQLSALPSIGSSNLPESIVKRYGQNVRKLVVNLSIVVYDINSDEDAIDVLGLVHQRAAW